MVAGNRNHARLTSAIAGLMLLMSNAYSFEISSATRTLLEQTGITAQTYSLSDLVGESSRTHAARCNSKPAREFITGFNAESVIFDLLSAFKKSHKKSIEPIEKWYQSSLAKKIHSAEQEFIDNASLTDFLQSEKYQNPDRQKLITNIVDNLQAPRFVAILSTEVEYAGIVHSGCISTNEAEGKINHEQRLADITRNDKDLTAILVRRDIIAETAYLYRNMSDHELERYEAFSSSETGSAFYATLIDAVQESFNLAGDRLNNSVRSELLGHIDF